MTRIADRLSVEGPYVDRRHRPSDYRFIVRLGDGAPFDFWLTPAEALALIKAVQGPAERLIPADKVLREGDARYARGLVRAHRLAGAICSSHLPIDAEVLERILWRAGLYSGPVQIEEAQATPSSASAGSVFAGGHTPRCLGGCKCDPPSAAAGERTTDQEPLGGNLGEVHPMQIPQAHGTALPVMRGDEQSHGADRVDAPEGSADPNRASSAACPAADDASNLAQEAPIAAPSGDESLCSVVIVGWLLSKGFAYSGSSGRLLCIAWSCRTGYDFTDLEFFDNGNGTFEAIVGHHASGLNPRMRIGSCDSLEDVQMVYETIRRINGYPTA